MRSEQPDWQSVPLHQRVAHYLETHTTATAHTAIQQLGETANPAFHRTPAEAACAIPVAVHYETPESVWQLLTLYNQALRQGSPPFWVTLALNSPSGAANTGNFIAAIDEFQKAYPGLPLAYSYTNYQRQEKIGRIKKDTADIAVAALLRHHGKNLPPWAAILQQDVDTRRLSYRMLGRLMRPLELGTHSITQANMRHARSNGRFPLMDTVIFWYDLAIALNPAALHDTHNVMSVEAYCFGRGHNTKHDLYEGIELQLAITKASSYFRQTRVPGTFATVSARRPYAFLQRGIPPTSMWGQDFSLDDGYRHMTAEDMEDISEATAKTFITDLSLEGNEYFPLKAPPLTRELRGHWAKVINTLGFLHYPQESSRMDPRPQLLQKVETVKRLGRGIVAASYSNTYPK